MTFLFSKQDGKFDVLANEVIIGEIPVIKEKGIDVEDAFHEIAEGIFQWSRRFTIKTPDADFSGNLCLDFKALYVPTYTMIPAIMYGENKWGKGPFPAGLVRDGVPWSFAYHRGSIPGATYSQGREWAVALYSTNDLAVAPCSCSLIPGDGSITHRLVWPEQEYPDVYLMKTYRGEGYITRSPLADATEFIATAIICLVPVPPATSCKRAWFTLLDHAWQQNYHEISPRFSPETAWSLGIRYTKEKLYRKTSFISAFAIGMTKQNARLARMVTGDALKVVKYYEIGWCGQNASLANSCLFDYLKTGDKSSLDIGLDVLDWWLQHAARPKGIPVVRFNEVPRKVLPAKEQDACNIGQMVHQYFDAARLAEKCGVPRPGYHDFALKTCDAMLDLQQSNGKIGKSWDIEAKVLETEGSIAAFLLPGFIDAYKETSEEKYLDAAKQGFDYYMDEFLEHDFSTAGALDSYCIDKESAIPFVTTALALFNITNDHDYLDKAVFASQYLATWQFHHSIPFPPDSRLGELHYDSYGGTSVSVAHHHLDPYGVKFVTAWLELAEMTGNPIWRQRARAIWAQSLWGVSDGKTPLRGITWPAGAQNEAAFHTWFGTRNDLSDWFVAWPTAFRLETLRLQPEWNIFG
jgi:hypothetical protein